MEIISLAKDKYEVCVDIESVVKIGLRYINN